MSLNECDLCPGSPPQTCAILLTYRAADSHNISWATPNSLRTTQLNFIGGGGGHNDHIFTKYFIHSFYGKKIVMHPHILGLFFTYKFMIFILFCGIKKTTYNIVKIKIDEFMEEKFHPIYC